MDTIADADGLTTVFTAVAVVQCGQTYHIRLAIADGSDQGLSSYVWLEAGSFKSPILNVTDNLGVVTHSNFSFIIFCRNVKFRALLDFMVCTILIFMPTENFYLTGKFLVYLNVFCIIFSFLKL